MFLKFVGKQNTWSLKEADDISYNLRNIPEDILECEALYQKAIVGEESVVSDAPLRHYINTVLHDEMGVIDFSNVVIQDETVLSRWGLRDVSSGVVPRIKMTIVCLDKKLTYVLFDSAFILNSKGQTAEVLIY